MHHEGLGMGAYYLSLYEDEHPTAVENCGCASKGKHKKCSLSVPISAVPTNAAAVPARNRLSDPAPFAPGVL